MTMLVLVLVLPAAAMIMSYMLITRHIREVQTAGGVMGQRMFKVSKVLGIHAQGQSRSAALYIREIDGLVQNCSNSIVNAREFSL